VDNRYPNPVKQRNSYAHYDPKIAYPQANTQQDYYREAKESIPSHEKRNGYGVIPVPHKTAKQAVVKTSFRPDDQRSRSKKSHRDTSENYGYPLPFRAFPPHPLQDERGKSSKRLSAALQHGYLEREDER